MNILERAVTPSTYTNALSNPGQAIKNITSDPAFGLVAGSLLGMPELGGFSATQAALMAGGISALASGSLQKGLMSGLSAYGGAGLAGSLSGAGEEALAARAAAPDLAGSGATIMPGAMTGGSAGAGPSALDKISAGFGSAADNPMDFLKSNYGKIGMAMAPILADKMVQTKTQLPTAGSLAGPSYIRPYQMTRTVRQPQAGIGSREQNWFDTSWEAGAPYKAANGGIVALADGGMTSQDAYDFLMGKSSNPDKNTPVDTVTKPPSFEGHYEYDSATGTSRWVPAQPEATPIASAVPTITKPIDYSKQVISGGGRAPMSDAAFASQQAQGEANANALSGLASLMPSKESVLNAINNFKPTVVQVMEALKSAYENSNMGMTNAANALSQANTVNGLTPAAVAMGGLGMANANQGIAAANNAAAIGMGNAAGNAGAAGTSTGPGGMAGATGQSGVAASVSAGNTGAASAAGPGSSGGHGGGNAGTGNGGTASGVGTGIGSGASSGAGLAGGGLSDLGSYSDGGRLLRGPGDGVSDSIPATIGHGQPARLADGEFVVPARIVSELGNGSTEAGARKLYAMMDRIQSARSKTVGKGRMATNSRADKYLPV